MGTFAMAQGVVPQATAPVVDGIMQKNEYAFTQSTGNFWLGIALSADKSTLNIGLAANTTGWISVGLGSAKMNGAYIVIGFDKDGKQTISEDLGKGHSHSPSGLHKVLQSVVKTTGNQTVIEFSIPAAEFIKNGKLPLILGASKADDLVSWHPLFKGLEVQVAN
jgi:hypothetical protein